MERQYRQYETQSEILNDPIKEHYKKQEEARGTQRTKPNTRDDARRSRDSSFSDYSGIAGVSSSSSYSSNDSSFSGGGGDFGGGGSDSTY